MGHIRVLCVILVGFFALSGCKKEQPQQAPQGIANAQEVETVPAPAPAPTEVSTEPNEPLPAETVAAPEPARLIDPAARAEATQ